jgi:hypothetical protein
MFLPEIKQGDKLILEFKPGFRNLFLWVVSGATFAGLVVYIILGEKIYLPIVKKVKRHLSTTKKRLKEDWQKEEEY